MERNSPKSPNKKLQRSIYNQLSPNLERKNCLKLRRSNFANSLVISAIIDQCGSLASNITRLDISYSITTSTTLKCFCSGLSQLQVLVAVKCNLSNIDEETPWPTRLQNIDLSRNKLTSLPKNLGCLLELTELNLSGNLITELDSSLLALPKLQKIHLVSNPIQNVPKSVCLEGVKDLREYFNITPLRIPSPDQLCELRDKNLELRRYVLHNQGSVDSAYESHRKASITSTCYSTSMSSFSDVESIDSCEDDWPQVENYTLPDGYSEAIHSSFGQVYLPDGCESQIEIEIIKDLSLYPDINSNELLISPVVQITPHGARFSDDKPAVIVLSHCTKPYSTSSVNILPLCSNTTSEELPLWERLPTKTPQIFQDCVMFSTTHFSLFAVVASVSYPSKSIIISPSNESLIEIEELPGFRIYIAQDSVPLPVTVKATVYYSDPPYAIDSGGTAAASACIGVEPHGIQFDSPVIVSIPIPHFNEIKELHPNADLELYSSSDQEMENGSFKWALVPNQYYDISTESDIITATFETMHFSLFEFIWTVGQDALNKIGLGATNAYKYLTSRKQFVSVRWQAFMTPPLSDLSFGLAVCVYKFGEPLQELSNYPWLVGDSGLKRVFLRVGELKVGLQGHFTASQDMSESLEHNTSVVDFRGDDFCARMDFALKLNDSITLPLQDGQILGKLSFTQTDGDRPIIMSYNLIKPKDTIPYSQTFSPSSTRSTRVCTPTITTLTPPWSPDANTQMDYDNVFVSDDSVLNPTSVPSISIPQKHQRQDSIDSCAPSLTGRAKRRLFPRVDAISDRTLMDIAQNACSKYTELGLRLDIPYKVIQSTVGSVDPTKSEHLKMFYILQEWKDRAASNFTFEVLSKALEDVGLASVAQRHCYSH